MIARVVIDIKHRDINQTYDYIIPENELNNVKKGMRVVVPFTDNNIDRMAIVVDILEESNFANKEIKEVLDLEPILDDEIFLMIDYLLKNPSTLIAKALETVVPQDLILNYQKTVVLLNEEELPQTLKSKFKKNKVWVLKKQDQAYYNQLKTLEKKLIVKLETKLKSKIAKKTIDYVEINDFSYFGTPKQNEVIKTIRSYESITKRYLSFLTSGAIVNTLIKRNVLKIVEKLDSIENNNYKLQVNDLKIVDSNIKRIEKLDSIKDKYVRFLIDGENETSQNLIANLVMRTVRENKQALILVPEVFLTPVFVDYYQKLFPNELVTVLDSLTATKEKYFNKQAILDNESKITIGSRSAIFSKFKSLGLIVMMQSSDSSYIQTEGIYYDTNELAAIKAKFNHCNLVLNTSVMKLKEYYDITQKTLKLIDLKEDNEKDALVHLVDMKKELLSGNTKMISNQLNEAMTKAIANNEKTLLIMNQKGYSPFVMCRSCGYVPKDKETDIVLNYSEKEGLLRSNLTKYTEKFTKTCPICSKDTMKPVGSGIEQLEHYLHKIYDHQAILRIDGDVLSNKALYEIAETLDENKNIKIIIGTNMALKNILAKKVSVVGVLMADQWMRLPKFDAKEQAYLTFMRAKHIAYNQLVIQTYDVDNGVLNAVKYKNDFYKAELKNRELQSMTPFYNLMQVMVESDSYLKTYQYAFNLKNELSADGAKVVGPSQSVLIKQNDKYRFLLLIKYKNLSKEINQLLSSSKQYKVLTSPEIIWY